MAKSTPHISKEQLLFLKEGVHFIEQKEIELAESAANLPFSKLDALLDEDFSWASLYELPFNQTVILIFSALGFLPSILEAVNSNKDVNQAIIDFTNKINSDSDAYINSLCNLKKEPETITELKNIRFSVFYSLSDLLVLSNAVLGELSAMRKYGRTISELVDDVRKRRHKDESFWQAIHIDPTVLSTEVFTRRMSIAYMHNDKDFFKILANAVKTKWKKNKTKTELDPLRVMLHALNEIKVLNNLSMDAADKLFIQELEVYSNDGEDPARSLYRFINRWKRTL